MRKREGQGRQVRLRSSPGGNRKCPPLLPRLPADLSDNVCASVPFSPGTQRDRYITQHLWQRPWVQAASEPAQAGSRQWPCPAILGAADLPTDSQKQEEPAGVWGEFQRMERAPEEGVVPHLAERPSWLP